MQFEKSRLGLLQEAFRSEGEGASRLAAGSAAGKRGVSVLENKVNTAGILLNNS